MSTRQGHRRRRRIAAAAFVFAGSVTLLPVGVANAYDAMQLTALALAKAGSSDGDKLREGFLNIDSYQGLIKNYTKPFTDANHDALNENDYVMVRYNGDQIEPITG